LRVQASGIPPDAAAGQLYWHGGQSAIIRSHTGAAVVSAADTGHGVVVAYEADAVTPDDHLGWSVLVTGPTLPGPRPPRGALPAGAEPLVTIGANRPGDEMAGHRRPVAARRNSPPRSVQAPGTMGLALEAPQNAG